MARPSLSVWNAKCYDPQQRLRWVERQRPNLLHKEGEIYILSAAFATDTAEYGVAKPELYIGLDTRAVLRIDDTLSRVVESEPRSAAYHRLPIKTNGGFLSFWTKAEDQDEPAVFTISAAVEFIAEGADIGRVTTFFLTTAPAGTDGKLILSTAMKRGHTLYEDYRLTVEVMINLRRKLAL